MAFIEDNLIGAIRSTSDTLLKCMMIVTAVEFCGSILTAKTGSGNTKKNFLAFWQSRYMPEIYHGTGELLYDILRNGVSHSFIAKGGVIPSANTAGSEKHMRFFNQGVFVYVPKLAEDIIGGIQNFLKDVIENKDLKDNYNLIISELQRSGKAIYDDFVKNNKIETSSEHIQGDIRPDVTHLTLIDPNAVTGSAFVQIFPTETGQPDR